MSFNDLFGLVEEYANDYRKKQRAEYQENEFLKEKNKSNVKSLVQFMFGDNCGIIYGNCSEDNSVQITVNDCIMIGRVFLTRNESSHKHEIKLVMEKGDKLFQINMSKYPHQENYTTIFEVNKYLLGLFCSIDIGINTSMWNNSMTICFGLKNVNYRVYLGGVPWYNAHQDIRYVFRIDRLNNDSKEYVYKYNKNSGYYEVALAFDSYCVSIIKPNYMSMDDFFARITKFFNQVYDFNITDLIKLFGLGFFFDDKRPRYDLNNMIEIQRETRINSVVWKAMGIKSVCLDDINSFWRYINSCTRLYDAGKTIDHHEAFYEKKYDVESKKIIINDKILTCSASYGGIYWWYRLWADLEKHKKKYEQVLCKIKF